MKLTVKDSMSKAKNITKYKGKVAYGVPEITSNKNREPGSSYNNAELLALMEAGSPINNMPQRKLLQPVLLKHKLEIDDTLAQIGITILKGEFDKADTMMERLALKMETWCKAYFVDPSNNWAPNAAITVKGGWMKNKVSGKPVYIKGKKSSRPLVDTGALRQSIKGVFYRKK